MNEAVGTRVHDVIAALAGAEHTPSVDEILEVVAASFRERPIGGSVKTSASLRCTTAVAVYFTRFAPVGWELLGSEVQLRGARADLVWSNPDGDVVVDEVKTGFAHVGDERIAEQLVRLDAGAASRWPDRFIGVRLVPLGSPSRSVVVRGAELVEVETPRGMEVRR